MKMLKISLVDTINGREYEIPNKEKLTLGRGDDNDITLLSIKSNERVPGMKQVSRVHCVFFQTKNEISVMDLGTKGEGSSNGTYVNGEMLLNDQECVLKI